ncbi:MAG TPA: hypothetical protein VJ254_01235 [Streptosporangiaceae bacterium]|nr:hypothetical protein [Streptosporangiaceae bacterium]
MANACHFAGQLLAAQRNSAGTRPQATAPVSRQGRVSGGQEGRLAVHDLRAVTRLTGPVAGRSDSV